MSAAEILAPGNYRGRSIEAAIGEAGTGTVQVAIRFAFLDFSEQSVTRVWYGYFTDAAQEGTIKAMRTAGWRGVDITDLSSLSADADPQPPEVILVVQHEPDQAGVMRDRIRWVNAATGGGMLKKKLEGEALTAFAAKMREAVKVYDAKTKMAGGTGAGSGEATASGGGADVKTSKTTTKKVGTDGIPF